MTTIDELIDKLENYTVGRLKKSNVQMTIEEFQYFIDKIKALKQQIYKDCINRKEVLALVYADWKYEGLESDIENLPPFIPQIKTGHWIRVDKDKLKCSECEVIHLIAQYPNGKIDWCPNCGTRMLTESEKDLNDLDRNSL